MTESEQFDILKAIFKKEIFQILDKFNVDFESAVAEEFKVLIDKIQFIIEKEKINGKTEPSKYL